MKLTRAIIITAAIAILLSISGYQTSYAADAEQAIYIAPFAGVEKFTSPVDNDEVSSTAGMIGLTVKVIGNDFGFSGTGFRGYHNLKEDDDTHKYTCGTVDFIIRIGGKQKLPYIFASLGRIETNPEEGESEEEKSGVISSKASLPDSGTEGSLVYGGGVGFFGMPADGSGFEFGIEAKFLRVKEKEKIEIGNLFMAYLCLGYVM